MVDRIKQVMEHYEETPTSFAEKVGVNRSNLTHLFSGRNQPSLEFAKKVLVAFPEVSTEWLIMGVGKMTKNPAEMHPVKKAIVQTDLFGDDDESKNDVPVVNDVTLVAVESIPQQASDEISLENVKPVEHEVRTQEVIQRVETKEVEMHKEPVITASELNIPYSTVQESGISDSRQLESEPTNKNSKEQTQAPLKEQSQAPREKKIEKIVFFYDDDTFKVYHP